MQYHTTDAAKACNVTLNTIRNWCKDYSAFLSAGATVATGQREFTGRDMDVFKYIALLRSEGMQKDAIVQRLGETTFSEIEPDAILAPPSLPETHHNAPAPLVALDDLQSRVALLERSVIETEQRNRPNLWWFAVGLAAGLGFAAVAELFALVAKR